MPTRRARTITSPAACSSALPAAAGGICNDRGAQGPCDQSAKVGLPGNLGDQETDGAVDDNQQPQLPGVPAAAALDHEHGPKKAKDGAGGAFDAGRGRAGVIRRKPTEPPIADRTYTERKRMRPSGRLKGLSEDPQHVHVEHNVEDEALRMDEGGGQHPPGFEGPEWGRRTRMRRRGFPHRFAGDQPLQHKDQGAEPDDQERGQRLAGGDGAAEDRPGLRGAFGFR